MINSGRRDVNPILVRSELARPGGVLINKRRRDIVLIPVCSGLRVAGLLKDAGIFHS